MDKSIFWDKDLSSKEIKKILSNEKHDRFLEFASLLFSRTNDTSKVFGSFVDIKVFCRNWRRIKIRMKKNKWNSERILYWDSIYDVARKKIPIRTTKAREAVSEDIKEIAKKIKTARQNKGWTQRELAEKTKTSQQLISFMENGYLNFSLETLLKLTKALDLEIIVRSS
ncbi:MAG: helix-turn-helix transcriptional regulator [Candidatus Omnitrophota bacterium]